MATATLYLVSVITSDITGANNALGAPDGVFTQDTTKRAWTARWGFDAVTGSTAPNGTHTITLKAAKSATGGSDVTVDTVNLHQGATTINLLPAPVTISAAVPGQDVILTFAGNQLTNLEGVEITVTGSGAGGGPNERGCEIDAITWVPEYTVLFGTPLNVYQNGQWVQGYLKYYNGTGWTEKVAKVYQGGVWTIV